MMVKYVPGIKKGNIKDKAHNNSSKQTKIKTVKSKPSLNSTIADFSH